MPMLVRAVFTLATCVAGIMTPGILEAPAPPPNAEPLRISPPPTLDTTQPPQMQVVHKPVPTHDERLALEALAPYVIAQQREEHGHCGEWYDEAMAVGWEPTEWKRLRYIIARETGNTCDPTVLNDNDQTRDLSYGLVQINMRGKLGPDRMARCGLTAYEDLWNPTTNLACARVLYLLAGWEPWAYTPK